MILPRIRTINEAFEMLKKEDPSTAITKNYIRRLVPYLPGSIKRGRGWLLNYDSLLQYLSNPNRLELDRLREYQQSGGKIRPVPENLGG